MKYRAGNYKTNLGSLLKKTEFPGTFRVSSQKTQIERQLSKNVTHKGKGKGSILTSYVQHNAIHTTAHYLPQLGLFIPQSVSPPWGGCSAGIFQPAAYRSYKTIEPSLPQALGTHSQLGGLEQCGINALPKGITCCVGQGSNPRPLGLETDALTIGPHVPTIALISPVWAIIFLKHALFKRHVNSKDTTIISMKRACPKKNKKKPKTKQKQKNLKMPVLYLNMDIRDMSSSPQFLNLKVNCNQIASCFYLLFYLSVSIKLMFV